MTVRRAIGMLLDQGAVSTTRGRGTFVQPLRLATATFDLSEFHDILAEPGVTAKVRRGARAARRAARRRQPRSWRTARTSSPSAASCSAATSRSSTTASRSSTTPRARPIESELDVTALRDMFEGGVGSGPKRGELILHASVLTEEEAGRLALSAGSAAWVLEHIFYGYDEKPISWGCFICRGDLFSFRASVGAPAPDGDTGARRNRR